MFSWDGNGDATKTKVGVVFRERTIHVPRERDDQQQKQSVGREAISIHVPRERDDSKNVAFCNKLTKAICANRSKEELRFATPPFLIGYGVRLTKESVRVFVISGATQPGKLWTIRIRTLKLKGKCGESKMESY